LVACVRHVAVLRSVGIVDFLNVPTVRRFAVINGSSASQRSRYSARQSAARNIDLNDEQTTNIKLSFLLPQQCYRVGVAAKTRAGVGAFSEVVFDTRSFNTRTYPQKPCDLFCDLPCASNIKRAHTNAFCKSISKLSK